MFEVVSRLLTIFAVSCFASSAQALSVQVDWTASVTPNAGGTPSLGSGLLIGSLGIFDVNAAGDVFELPADGSLTVIASGFSGGFPNQSYALTRSGTFPLLLEFLTVGLIAEDFSATFRNFAILLSDQITPCLVSGISGVCQVTLSDDFGGDVIGGDVATAGWNALGELPIESSGTVNFTFTIVPEPSTATLLALGLVGIAAGRRRTAARSGKPKNPTPAVGLGISLVTCLKKPVHLKR
jgi:hypothetical protein